MEYSWNHVAMPYDISAKFDVDMAFNVEGIKGMLDEYESDYHTGIDTVNIANLIYDYKVIVEAMV
jgi:hypothetical protein